MTRMLSVTAPFSDAALLQLRFKIDKVTIVSNRRDYAMTV
jgi:hypothetical protein